MHATTVGRNDDDKIGFAIPTEYVGLIMVYNNRSLG